MPKTKIPRRKHRNDTGRHTAWRTTTSGKDRTYTQKAYDPATEGVEIGTSGFKHRGGKAPMDKKQDKPSKRAKPTGKNYRAGGKTISFTKGSSASNPGKSQSRLIQRRKKPK